ncbi:MAG: YjzD family protein [Lactobacillus sp.]|nr:YjzD family protein [Lactobacillus sp.]MDN6043066.1 YjzD family protein [Lactobacillus sp.]MDN6052335.1 YjzD family protein [Lactobacillus sp.]
MGRFIVTIFWSIVYMFIIGFIGGPLTQTSVDFKTLLIFGVVFGIIFSLIIPTITAHSHHDDSSFSRLK